jgi:multicomponent Na+:H+ antiporter subunit A
MLLGVFFAFVAPLLTRGLKDRAAWILALVPLSFTIFFIQQISFLPSGPIVVSFDWTTLYSAHLSFSLDGLSLLFALMISFFGVLIIIFGGEYLKGHRDLGKFFSWILLFMISMLGLVLSDNLILLFVFWELTTFSSFLLIGFNHEREDARKSAWQAILITTSGGLAMLAGFILLGEMTGSYQISTLLDHREKITSHELYLPMLTLVLAGAFTKSAQFPFHFWLPSAMAAPTPVSAYLHSATMVKAGIYLLARFLPIIGHTTSWSFIVSSVGGVTMVVGSLFALKQNDLKLLLAYMTIMALGVLTLLLGIGSLAAIKAFVIFLVLHSLYKGALFLIAGGIDHGAGTRELSALGGLRKKMPFTTAIAFISLLSMAGMPPLIGFLGKEMIYEAALETGGFLGPWIIVMSVFAMGASTAVACIFFFKVFWGPFKGVKAIAESAPSLLLPPLILGMIGLILGLFPGLLESSLIRSSVSVILGQIVESQLFHGTAFNMALALSGLSTGLGVVIYLNYDRMKSGVIAWEPWGEKFSFSRLFHQVLVALPKNSLKLAELLMRGYYTKYLLIIISTLTLVLFFVFFSKSGWYYPSTYPSLAPYEWIIIVGIAFAAITSALATTVFTSVILLGVVGFGVALLFVIYGAPDLALTQFLIETLTIIFIALIAIKFPPYRLKKKNPFKFARDLTLSLSFGGMITIILWSLNQVPFDPYLSEYFAENSYLLGKGRNIVNVILVDFRALDTLGEMTVLVIGSLSVFGLIKLATVKEGSK